MKYSESWLREWVNPNLTIEALANLMTMSGMEVEELLPAGELSAHVLIGQVESIKKNAAHLATCIVNVGKQPIQIVCGAPNVKVGMKAPVALVGARLPSGDTIKESEINQIKSQGMLCSANELGLGEESDRLMVLPPEAPVGAALSDYLKLNEIMLTLSITPNRGDCLSIRGLAREIAALTKTPLNVPFYPVQKAAIPDLIPVTVEAKADCPHYVGRVICDVDTAVSTPIWLKERLRRAGTRSINPIVDVMNYVMYELGQPMHAFDLAKLHGKIIVRYANANETIKLLDESEKRLSDETLIIADEESPIAIAGVMGGLDSSVTPTTQAVFLESAFFMPKSVARGRQYYQLHSESAYRYERGVDPTMQREAIERATQLVLAICGGKAGPLVQVLSPEQLPSAASITLEKAFIPKVLGTSIADKEVTEIFKRLAFTEKPLTKNAGWEVGVPSYRFDLSLPEDLIEEIARLYGYDQIPLRKIRASLDAHDDSTYGLFLQDLRIAMAHLGYHEIISYSFVDKKLEQVLSPHAMLYELINPITAEMTVMRTSLLSGLLTTLKYNKSRQQNRLRIFEIGTCFTNEANQLKETFHLGGLITGSDDPLQWGEASRDADFFDLKGDIEKILPLIFSGDEIIFQSGLHTALHPGQSARLYTRNQCIGWLGALHPNILQVLDLNSKVYAFELFLPNLPLDYPVSFVEVSKFPEIRRDIAIVINQAVPAKEIQDTIKKIAGDWLKDIFIFDVYQGKGIAPGLKSIAFALILQDASRTLRDEEVASLMERVINALKGQFGAELRS